MKFWYKDHKEEWNTIIDTISYQKGYDKKEIEKDIIQSIILKKLSESDYSIVFKGGTSLSKVYNLIDRFSEDIDIATTSSPTEGERKEIKKLVSEIADDSGLIINNIESILSRHKFNHYELSYKSVIDNSDGQIILETSFLHKSYPVETKTVQSIVGKYLDEKNLSLPFEFDANSFIMQVQSLERTFVDKVFAVCDYYLNGETTRHSRHLYDIAKLASAIDIKEDTLKNLIEEVRIDRQSSYRNSSAQSGKNITEILTSIIQSQVYKQDYETVTMDLLREKMTYEEAVLNGIQMVRDLDLFHRED